MKGSVSCEGRNPKKDKTHPLSNKGWGYLEELAQVWKEININLEDIFSSLKLQYTWVKTAHIHAKLRVALRDKLRFKTPSVHKKLTESGKKRHNSNFNHLKLKLHSYQAYPFEEGHARPITVGAEMYSNVVNGLIEAADIGNMRYTQSIKEGLVSGNITF